MLMRETQLVFPEHDLNDFHAFGALIFIDQVKFEVGRFFVE